MGAPLIYISVPRGTFVLEKRRPGEFEADGQIRVVAIERRYRISVPRGTLLESFHP
jgi:hypothetical protein